MELTAHVIIFSQMLFRFGVGAGLSGCCSEWIGRGKEGLVLVLAYLGVAVNGLGEGRKV